MNVLFLNWVRFPFSANVCMHDFHLNWSECDYLQNGGMNAFTKNKYLSMFISSLF